MTWDEWESGYVVARMWHCGDEYCNCLEPRIEQVSPNREAGYPWVRRETLWTGTFVSTGESGLDWPDGVTYDSLVEEMGQAARNFPVSRWVL